MTRLLTLFTFFVAFSFSVYSQELKNPSFSNFYGNGVEQLLDGPTLSGRTTGIAFSDNGDLYLLDTGRHEVIVYDQELKEKFSFGQKGKGPGEFENPTDIYISEVGKIYITDASLLRVSVFELDGEYINSLPLDFRATDLIVFENSLCLHAGGIIPKDHQAVKCFNSETGEFQKSLLDLSEVIGTKYIGFANTTFNMLQSNGKELVVLQHPFDATIYIFDKDLNLKKRFIVENEIFQQPDLPNNYNMMEHKPSDYADSYVYGIYVYDDRIMILFIEFGTGTKFLDIYDIFGNRLISNIIDMERKWPVYVDKQGNLYSFSFTDDKEGINLKKYISKQ